MQLHCVCSDARRSGLWHRGRVTIDPARAFQRFADALNRPRDPALLRAAVIDEVRIDRHAPGERGAPVDAGAAPVVESVVESFVGVAEVERWFARTPPVVQFALAGPARPDGDAWVVEYTIEVGEFHNGGTWLARLAGDGRIAFLSHRPFALRDGSGPPGAPHPHGGSGHTHGG
jgi:hypothetical protein